MKSIKSQITFFITLAAVFSTLSLAFSLWLHKSLALRAEMKIEATKLSNTAIKQAEMLIPGLLLEEEYGAVAPQLDEIKKQENLLNVQYLPNGSPAIANYDSCEEHPGNVKICYDSMDGQISTLTSILVGTNNIGYLQKTKSVSVNLGVAWISFLTLFILNSVVFLLLIGSILWFLQSKIYSPIQMMLKHFRLSSNESLLNLSHLQVSEIHDIAKELNTTITERQKSVQLNAQADVAKQLAHDIRGPLSLVEALASKLKKSEEGSDNAALLESVSKRIHRIADELLSKNKIEILSDQEQFLKFLHELESRASLAHVEFTTDLCHVDSIGRFHLDVPTLNRAVSNLFDNALYACQQKEGSKIHFSIRYNQIGHELEISLEDTGLGLPTHSLERLGEKGFTWGKRNGTGLGLYQARLFCEAHHGELRFENRAQGGSKVSLVFRQKQQKPLATSKHVSLK